MEHPNVVTRKPSINVVKLKVPCRCIKKEETRVHTTAQAIKKKLINGTVNFFIATPVTTKKLESIIEYTKSPPLANNKVLCYI